MAAINVALLTAATALSCTIEHKSDSGSDGADESGGAESMPIPDLGAPASCESARLPVFDGDPCALDQDRVAVETPSTIEPKPDIPDAESVEFHWRWSCVVVSVALSPACDEIEIGMRCDDAGVIREVRNTFLAGLNPEPAIAPGMVVDYDVDHRSAFEGYGWTSARVVGTDGILISELHLGGWLDNAEADPLVENALSDFSGRRTAPICVIPREDGDGHRYAIELTVDGETITVPHDTAADLGDYRILVADAWSGETPDFGPSTYHGIDVLIFRMAP